MSWRPLTDSRAYIGTYMYTGTHLRTQARAHTCTCRHMYAHTVTFTHVHSHILEFWGSSAYQYGGQLSCIGRKDRQIDTDSPWWIEVDCCCCCCCLSPVQGVNTGEVGRRGQVAGSGRISEGAGVLQEPVQEGKLHG